MSSADSLRCVLEIIILATVLGALERNLAPLIEAHAIVEGEAAVVEAERIVFRAQWDAMG